MAGREGTCDGPVRERAAGDEAPADGARDRAGEGDGGAARGVAPVVALQVRLPCLYAGGGVWRGGRDRGGE